MEQNKKDYYKNLVNQSKWSIRLVPINCITHEMCLSCVTHHGFILRYIPKRFHNEEICFNAIEHSPHAIQFVSKKCKTYQLKKYALSLDIQTMHFVGGIDFELLTVIFESDKYKLSMAPSLSTYKLRVYHAEAGVIRAALKRLTDDELELLIFKYNLSKLLL